MELEPLSDAIGSIVHDVDLRRLGHRRVMHRVTVAGVELAA